MDPFKKNKWINLSKRKKKFFFPRFNVGSFYSYLPFNFTHLSIWFFFCPVPAILITKRPRFSSLVNSVFAFWAVSGPFLVCDPRHPSLLLTKSGPSMSLSYPYPVLVLILSLSVPRHKINNSDFINIILNSRRVPIWF